MLSSSTSPLSSTVGVMTNCRGLTNPKGGSRTFNEVRARARWGLRLLACFALVGVGTLHAQTETGQITGTVTDPSGAGVPNAQITAKSKATQLVRTTATNAMGEFVMTNLLPAVYDVRAQAPGFKSSLQQVEVAVGSKARVDLKLEIGSPTTVVEVSAAPVAVNTETQTVGMLIDSKKLTELPTLTRNPYDLVATAGNVASNEDAGIGVKGATTRGAGFNINGLRSASSNVLLDGAANNDEFTASVGQHVPLDSVQEFSVLTNNFTAEYGRATGGVVNVVTKSGTNDIHGTAYEFNRVSRLAANTFDNNARSIAKPVFVRNQPGYGVGGPIKKDKLFFFQSTEWIRVRSASPTVVFIPDAALISASNSATQGLFSAFGTKRPGLTTLKTFSKNQLLAASFDPCSGATTGPCASYNSNAPMFDQVNYNVPNDAGGGSPQDSYELVGRVDWNISSKSTLYGRYALESQNFQQGTNVNSPYKGFDGGETKKNNNLLLSLTRTFSPTFASQSKVVFNRLNDQQPLGDAPVGPTLYMLSNTTAKILGTKLAFPGYTPFSPGNAIPFGGPQNFLQAYEDVSKMKGSHQLRFGGSYVHIQDNRTFGAYEEAVETLSTTNFGAGMNNFLTGNLAQFQAAIDPLGKFPCKFPSAPATLPPPAPPGTANPQAGQCANPATGPVGSQTIDQTGNITLPVGQPNFSRSNRYNEFALYAQDSWRVTRRVTINYGLRWEYYGVQHNKNPQLDSNYYDGSGSNIFQQIRAGSIQIAPNSPIGGLWQKNYKDFAPRVGVAWDVFGDGRTSLRGGYGIGYERNFGNVTFNVIQNPPAYAVISLIANTSDTGGLPIPITTANAGPLAGSTGSKAFPKASMRNVNPNITTAYAHFWSVSAEHELRKSVFVGLDYTGSKGVNLYSLENPNRFGSGPVYLGDPCSNPQLTLTKTPDPQCLSRLQPLQVTNINRRGNGGLSRYDGLNFRVNVRDFAHTGVTLTTNYTWAHALDNLSSTFSESTNNNNLGLLDPFNPQLDRGHADFDIRHRLAISAVWEIPFARSTHGAAKHVLDGWTLAPIFTARTGTPFTLFDCTNTLVICPHAMFNGAISGSGSGSPSPIAGSPNTFNFINIASLPVNSTYLNPKVGMSDFGPYPSNMSARNFFRGPGAWDTTLGIYKTTRVSERVSLQVRGEFFNLFNHSNLYFNGSDNDVSSSSFVAASKGIPPVAFDERRNIQLALKLIF